jgi:hypothetical protein
MRNNPPDMIEGLAEAFRTLRIGHKTIRDLIDKPSLIRAFAKQLYKGYAPVYHPDLGHFSNETFDAMSQASSLIDNASDEQLSLAGASYLDGAEFGLTGIRMELQSLQRRIDQQRTHEENLRQALETERKKIKEAQATERKLWNTSTQAMLLALGVDEAIDGYRFARQMRDYLLTGEVTSKGETIKPEPVEVNGGKGIPYPQIRWVDTLSTTLYYINASGQVFIRTRNASFRPRIKADSARELMASKLLTHYGNEYEKKGGISTSRVWKPHGVVVGAIPRNGSQKLAQMAKHTGLFGIPITVNKAAFLFGNFIESPILGLGERAFNLVTLKAEIKEGKSYFTFYNLYVSSSLFAPTHLPTFNLGP